MELVGGDRAVTSEVEDCEGAGHREVSLQQRAVHGLPGGIAPLQPIGVEEEATQEPVMLACHDNSYVAPQEHVVLACHKNSYVAPQEPVVLTCHDNSGTCRAGMSQELICCGAGTCRVPSFNNSYVVINSVHGQCVAVHRRKKRHRRLDSQIFMGYL